MHVIVPPKSKFFFVLKLPIKNGNPYGINVFLGISFVSGRHLFFIYFIILACCWKLWQNGWSNYKFYHTPILLVAGEGLGIVELWNGGGPLSVYEWISATFFICIMMNPYCSWTRAVSHVFYSDIAFKIFSKEEVHSAKTSRFK